MRVSVVEEGPHSVGLLPIPADRQRAEPLPEDTVDIELLVVDRSGTVPDEDLDVRWFVCPLGARCPFGADLPAAAPCEGRFDPAQPCVLGSGVRPMFTVPALDPQFTLLEQFRWNVVALVGVRRSADACLGQVAGEEAADPERCVLALTGLDLGPLGALLDAARTSGVELGFDLVDLDVDLALPSQPNFHPEVVRVVFGREDTGLSIVATPGTTTQIPANTELLLLSAGDQRDAQQYAELAVAPDGEVVVGDGRGESLSTSLYAIEADRIEREVLLTTGEPGDSASILVVRSDSRLGHSWAWFDFEVVEWHRP